MRSTLFLLKFIFLFLFLPVFSLKAEEESSLLNDFSDDEQLAILNFVKTEFKQPDLSLEELSLNLNKAAKILEPSYSSPLSEDNKKDTNEDTYSDDKTKLDENNTLTLQEVVEIFLFIALIATLPYETIFIGLESFLINLYFFIFGNPDSIEIIL